ncbi:MAG: sulfite exporter TauE/SafE family protein, partial [Rhodospirillaceae bacterium]|nr:sulfite exporter TauE/SafE family protein [Rhodospirillaceae bacterium]
RLGPLALVGGTLDAIGGGGWGPIVTSSMIGWGVPPRVAIGTSNSVEFFVTIVVTGALLPQVAADMLPIVAGLIIGGILAAPIAALMTKRLPVRLLMGLVGLTITLISVNDLTRAWAAW